MSKRQTPWHHHQKQGGRAFVETLPRHRRIQREGSPFDLYLPLDLGPERPFSHSYRNDLAVLGQSQQGRGFAAFGHIVGRYAFLKIADVEAMGSHEATGNIGDLYLDAGKTGVVVERAVEPHGIARVVGGPSGGRIQAPGRHGERRDRDRDLLNRGATCAERENEKCW